MKQDLEQGIPPILIWIRPPGSNTGINNKQKFKLNCAMYLARHQANRAAHFVLELPGPPVKSEASSYLCEQAAKDLPPECSRVITIRCCNLGISTGTNRDSRMTSRHVHLLTNLNLPRDWNGCLCGRSVADHADTPHKFLKERIHDHTVQVLAPVVLSHLTNALQPEHKFQFAMPIARYLRDLPIGIKERISPPVMSSLGLTTTATPTR